MSNEDYWVQVVLRVKIGWAPGTLEKSVVQGVLQEEKDIIDQDDFVNPLLKKRVEEKYGIDLKGKEEVEEE